MLLVVFLVIILSRPKPHLDYFRGYFPGIPKQLRLYAKILHSYHSGRGRHEDAVRLNRYSSGWSELDTTLVSESASFVNYTAKTPGFSVFAIAIKGQALAGGPEQPAEQTGQPGQPGRVPTGESPEMPIPASSELIIVAIIIIAIVALGWFYFHGPLRKKKP